MRRKQMVKVIILAGRRDFGRCPLASRLPTALWPVAGKTVLERLLAYLANQGIKQVTICSNGDGPLLQQSIKDDIGLELKFLDEPLPVGTAGCIRDAAGHETDALLVVLPASIVYPPNIDVLINAHLDGGSDLTVVFNPNPGNNKSPGQPAGIYVCNPRILKYIPDEGYFDIKEGLIPEMLRTGKTVHRAILPHNAGNFRDRPGYLDAIADYLVNTAKPDNNLRLYRQNDSQIIWVQDNVNIDPSARIYGPVIILNNACICKDVIVFGPTIIGRNVMIKENSVVTNSVLWDDAQIGPNCQTKRCVADYHAAVPGNTVLVEQPITFKPRGMLGSAMSSVFNMVRNNATKLRHALQEPLDKLNGKLPKWAQPGRVKIIPWFAVSLVFIAFLWSYWPQLVELWGIWQRSDEYSSGLLVPPLAVYVLWSRRHDIALCPIRPCIWGLFVFIAAQVCRLFGLFFFYPSAERLSIALSIAALVLLLCGWQFLRRVATVLLFLCLMLPWPTRIQTAVTLPLQQWATSSAVFCLEMVGYDVIQEGNIIHIGQSTVAVAEACNGLRMITAFFVIGGLVVLLVKRAWWEKLIVLASSLPIALLCNTVRLAVTAIAFTVVSGEYWEKMFHDFGGYAMMPLALVMVVAELWFLAKLTMLPTEQESVIIARQKVSETRMR